MPDRGLPKEIPLITTTDALAAFCESLVHERYITVDTEFLRETTYYPKLCLIQIIIRVCMFHPPHQFNR